MAWAQPGAPANLDLDEVRGSHVRASQRRLVATVTDLYGNLVPNAKLTLTAKGGRVSPSRAVSDATRCGAADVDARQRRGAERRDRGHRRA